jgi:hypothetical protein
MCEANFRIFRHHELCYIIINMLCFFLSWSGHVFPGCALH